MQFPKDFRTGLQRFLDQEAATRSVLKNFVKFTGKHLYKSLCFNKLASCGLQLY